MASRDTIVVSISSTSPVETPKNRSESMAKKNTVCTITEAGDPIHFVIFLEIFSTFFRILNMIQ